MNAAVSVCGICCGCACCFYHVNVIVPLFLLAVLIWTVTFFLSLLSALSEEEKGQ